MEQQSGATTWYLLEERQRFSQSLLWELQRRYFDSQGIEAWRQGEVPLYVTSSPTLANSYAEIVFALWRDQQRRARAAEPLYLCELGAGSGRFAFHFLSRLAQLCEQAGVALASFRYVLTDLVERNLAFWRSHPRFQAFFDAGVLDIARFDISRSDQIALQLRGETIGAGDLQHPLVVIANYVFDSIPQELYYLDEQGWHDCLLSLAVDADPAALGATDLLARLRYHYEYEALAGLPECEDFLQPLLAEYQRTLADTHLLFPAAGLRCLQRLRALSRQGLLLLSADKGDHQLAALQGQPPPILVHHGSFSLNVNYHAFRAFCEQRGGLFLFPNHPHQSVNVSCCLLFADAAGYDGTQRAYQRHVQDFGPDDFYTITRHARQYIPEMAVEDILAYLRLSYYDSHQFARYLPRLFELGPAMDQGQRQVVRDAVDRVWAGYFTLGEALDLAHQIAHLLYAMDDYTHALAFFERSTAIYGSDTGTLYNMAVCHHMLGHDERVAQLLRTVLLHDPENEPARTLLAAYEV